MMYWRASADKFGEHYRVRLFCTKTKGGTFAKVGELTMLDEEWEDLKVRLDLMVTGGSEAVF
jgi:hypothetical protein